MRSTSFVAASLFAVVSAVSGCSAETASGAPNDSDSIGFGEADLRTGGAASIAMGGGSACIVTNGGAVKCWGNNDYGQLGDRTDLSTSVPVTPAGWENGMKSVALGAGFICGLRTNGDVECLGYSIACALGYDSEKNATSPQKVKGLPAINHIAAGHQGAYAIAKDGSVWRWGRTDILFDTPACTPKKWMDPDAKAAAIAAGNAHVCVLASNGGATCAGHGVWGQLGNGSSGTFYEGTRSLVDVWTLKSGVASISAGGGDFTCAVTTEGEAKCWGGNDFGQIGNGKTSTEGVDVPFTAIDSKVKAVSTGRNHACALTTGGAVKCWGKNERGELGPELDGVNEYARAYDVPGLSSGVKAVAAGDLNSCAIVRNGHVKCWGRLVSEYQTSPAPWIHDEPTIIEGI